MEIYNETQDDLFQNKTNGNFIRCIITWSQIYTHPHIYPKETATEMFSLAVLFGEGKRVSNLC